MRAAVGAILNREGGPVGSQELEALASRADLPWGGGPRLYPGEGCGLLWIPASPSATLPPPGGAAVPFGIPAAGRFTVVVDGTLDNRADLARQLGLPPAAAALGSEPLLIAAACERWGAECPMQLIGEIAFLAWDRRERRLLAARDAAGSRELFFADSGRQLRFASQSSMIRDRPTLSDLDEEYVADLLASADLWGPATPFKSVRRLEIGHRLEVADGRLETRRYWAPADRPLLRYRTDGEYGEHFLAVFREAVGHCLATGGRVWSDLSGGLDSSAIVCIAAELLDGDPERRGNFATLTHVWQDSPQCDERELAQTVVDKVRLPNHQVWCDDLFFDGAEEECLCRNDPHQGLFIHPMSRVIAELLRSSGVAVLLCGMRAEAVVLPETIRPLHLADLARSLRLGRLARELWQWQRATHQPLANLLLACVARPLFGRRRYDRPRTEEGLDPWVDKAFARRLQLATRAARKTLTDKRFRAVAQQQQYEMLLRTEQMMHRGLLEWSCEIRHPFLYRPLVELGLAMPWQQMISPGRGKLLLRRGLAGRLPEAIRNRRGGAGPGAAMYKAFARRWPAIEPVVASSLLVELGYVDRKELHAAADMVRFGTSKRFVNFLTCLAFEVWLRTVTGEGQAVAAGRSVSARP